MKQIVPAQLGRKFVLGSRSDFVFFPFRTADVTEK